MILRILAGLLFRAAARLAIVLVAVVSLALPLAMIFSVQRSMDTAAYDFGMYETVSEIYVFPEDLERVRSDFGERVYLSAPWELPIMHDGREVTARARVTATPEASMSGWFPSRTQRSGPAVDADQWVDLSAGLAAGLGARAGDIVTVSPAPGVFLDLPVRSVHDQRLEGESMVAQISAAPLHALVVDPAARFQSELLTDLPVEEVSRILADPFYTERFEAGGYLEVMPPVTREALLAERGRQSTTGLSLVLVTALLGALGGAFFLVREVIVFARRAHEELAPLLPIGVAQGDVRRSTLLTGGVAAAVGVAVGALLATVPFSGGLFAASFPVYWAGRWMLIGAAILMLAWVVLAAVVQREQP